MKTIQLRLGQSIESGARELCAQAPARADFNGIMLRARYATTRPEDVAMEYGRRSRAQSAMWSPERTARAARWAAEQEATRKRIAAECSALPTIDWTDHAEPLAWIERVVEENIPNASGIASIFGERGYVADACTDDAFDGENRDNVARFIVGQAMANLARVGAIHPMCGEFVRRWRSKFGS